MSVVSPFRPEITEALATADRLVTPWLAKGDTWRKSNDGLPLEEDVMVVLARLRGDRGVDLRVYFRHLEYTVGDCDSRDEFSALTYPEALLLLLADDLKRTCGTCREYDGHDASCPVLATALAEEAS